MMIYSNGEIMMFIRNRNKRFNKETRYFEKITDNCLNSYFRLERPNVFVYFVLSVQRVEHVAISKDFLLLFFRVKDNRSSVQN